MRKRKRNNWMKTLESPQKGGMRPLKSKKSVEYRIKQNKQTNYQRKRTQREIPFRMALFKCIDLVIIQIKIVDGVRFVGSNKQRTSVQWMTFVFIESIVINKAVTLLWFFVYEQVGQSALVSTKDRTTGLRAFDSKLRMELLHVPCRSNSIGILQSEDEGIRIRSVRA